jgi:hypothetical protein
VSEISEQTPQSSTNNVEIKWPGEKGRYSAFIREKAVGLYNRMRNRPKPVEIVTPGVLEKASLDDLRQTIENLTPAQREHERLLIAEANDNILSKYGQYIDKYKSNNDINDKFIFVDEDMKIHFLNEWVPNASSYADYSDLVIIGTDEKRGRFFVGQIDHWNFLSEPEKDVFRENFNKRYNISNEDDIAEIYNDDSKREVYVHEVAHDYEDETLPLEFRECGAYYYGKELKKPSSYASVFEADQTYKYSAFYRGLIEIYGDDIHKLFFGSLKNESIRREILEEFTTEVVVELFPEVASA